MRIVQPNDRSLLASGCQQVAAVIESHARERAVVSLEDIRDLFSLRVASVDVHPDSAFLLVWASEHSFFLFVGNGAQAERVCASLDVGLKTEVLEVVDVNLLLEDDDDFVLAETNC